MPRKDKTDIERRRKFVKRKLAKSKNTKEDIKKLRKSLFISERQIYRDWTS